MKVVFFTLEPKAVLDGIERKNAGRRWYRLRAMPSMVIHAPDFDTALSECPVPAVDAACIVHDDGAVQWRVLSLDPKGAEYAKNAVHRHRRGRKDWVVFGDAGARFDPRKY